MTGKVFEVHTSGRRRLIAVVTEIDAGLIEFCRVIISGIPEMPDLIEENGNAELALKKHFASAAVTTEDRIKVEWD